MERLLYAQIISGNHLAIIFQNDVGDCILDIQKYVSPETFFKPINENHEVKFKSKVSLDEKYNDIDWITLPNGKVVIVAVNVYILLVQFQIQQDYFEEQYTSNEIFIDSTEQAILNCKLVKSGLFTEKFYLIFTFIREDAKDEFYFFVGFTNTNTSDVKKKKLNLQSFNDINFQRPLLALHPLSSQVSQSKSYFKGMGLDQPNQFDDFWLYVFTEQISNIVYFNICLVKSNLQGNTSGIEDIYALDNQTGTAMGFDPIPSTSSVIVNIKA